ncbi:hypothetical protein ACIBJC_29250 [Streptomyces sp. NPDC050509]|uniref:hypothetical protein n=1 Tax=Streptomyces sp. NPDC050509 TaxID=3365620 RepID=UPI0037BBC5E4
MGQELLVQIAGIDLYVNHPVMALGATEWIPTTLALPGRLLRLDLTLTAEHRRGHGAMYDALNYGNVDVPRPWQMLTGLPAGAWFQA